ncbi:MAG: alpha/beta fold hydrolase [Polyangiales bacterium]
MRAPIVFLHGFPLDRRMWEAQADAGMAIDLRGFGERRGALVRTIDAFADDVIAELDARGIDRAIVCGLSMGGYVALAMHRRHRTRIAGLILADTKATPDDDEAKKGRAANIVRARSEGPGAVFDAMAPKVLASQEHAPAMRTIAASQDPEAIVAALEAMRDRPDATAELSAIEVPTRIVVGSDDRVTPLADAERMARAIGNATLHVIEGAGHFSNIERPEAFRHAALDGW